MNKLYNETRHKLRLYWGWNISAFRILHWKCWVNTGCGRETGDYKTSVWIKYRYFI